MIVDEAHHAIGNHPYVQIVEKAKEPRLVGLTACFLHGKFRTPYEKKEKLEKHFRGEFWVAEEEDIKDYLPEFNFDSIYFAKAADTNCEDERQRLGACLDALKKMLDDFDDLPNNLSKHWEVRLFWKKTPHAKPLSMDYAEGSLLLSSLPMGIKLYLGKLGLLLADTFKICVPRVAVIT